MENPYSLLGLDKNASDKEIKASYRNLAKKYHPDINPGDKAKEKQFKKISTAYEIISNPKKRADYDNGLIDAQGNPSHQHYGHYNPSHGRPQTDPFSQHDMDDILSSMFGKNTRSNRRHGFEQDSYDVQYTIEIDFLEAVHGAKKTIQIPNNKKLDIAIPKGIKEGQKLRLKGHGHAHPRRQTSGDAYITVHIRPHPFFERKENDIYLELPISIDESILGKKVTIPTVHGPVDMQLPKGVNSGTSMKLKGKGILTGDQYVKLKIVMPKEIDYELAEFIQKWSSTNSYNPRKQWGKMG
jgi:DnaJ-class molecular chaperone